MAGLTDTGKVRPHNEDFIAFDRELGVALVADGMGAHAAGEVASRLAVETMQGILRQTMAQAGREQLESAVRAANIAIQQKADTSIRFHGMGTTIVAASIKHDRLYYAHVGDSRLYRLRQQSLEALTRDHSLLQEFIDQGLYTPEEARQKVARNILTRALGLEADVKVDLGDSDIQAGDRYLLCSDGLYEMLSDEDIAAMLIQEPDPVVAVRNLVELANIRGGRDNLSVIVIDAGR